jgi:hypothetical protein
MTPEAFLAALGEQPWRKPWPTSIKGWTRFMAPRIRGACSGRFCCSRTGAAAPLAVQDGGLHREHLFDFTFYRDDAFYRLPEVIVEHENSHRPGAFMYDFWKLMLGYAPLRVMFGYAANEHGVASRAALIHSTSTNAGWVYPPGVSDLVLLRSRETPPMEWQILERRDGSSSWTARRWTEGGENVVSER